MEPARKNPPSSTIVEIRELCCGRRALWLYPFLDERVRWSFMLSRWTDEDERLPLRHTRKDSFQAPWKLARREGPWRMWRELQRQLRHLQRDPCRILPFTQRRRSDVLLSWP